MTPELLDTVLALSPEDRQHLADILLDSLIEHEPPTPEQIAEVERRAAASAADPSRLIPGDVFMARLRARYGG